MKPITVLFALSLAACSSNATSSFIPTKGTAPNIAPNVHADVQRRASSQQYVYVADAGDATHHPALLAYPIGVQNPAPAVRVQLNDTPYGVAVDSKGRVYVALWNTNTVAIYKPGLTGLASNSYTDQIYRPEGVAIDENDNVYIASHCTSCSAGYVAEFPAGTYRNPVKIYAPSHVAVTGVAARDGYLYMDLFQNVGGAVDQYQLDPLNGWQSTQWQIDLGSSAGVALDNNKNLYVANVGMLQKYTPPGHLAVGTWNEGQCAVRFVGRGSDGSIYAPVDGVGWASVVVWPAGSQTQYSITTGLITPVGAAAD